MGRIYSATFNGVSVSAAQDLFQLEAGAGSTVILHRVTVSQSSDFGDAEAEGIAILIRRVTDTVTNDVTEVKRDPGDAAADANVAVNETTQLVTGAEDVHAEVWNVQLPFDYLPLPEHRPRTRDTFTVDLTAAPATDAMTMSGTIVWEEVD